MHPEAFDFVARRRPAETAVPVLDIGGRNINGTVAGLFPGSAYTVLDQLADQGVDIVADAASWRPERPEERFGIVVCCEVLEHASGWREILRTAHEVCEPGGTLLVTTAGPERAPHSAFDGAAVQPGEHYANLQAQELADGLLEAGWLEVLVEWGRGHQDLYARARA